MLRLGENRSRQSRTAKIADMCRLIEFILSTRSADFTKHTKLHLVDEKLRTWTSRPGSWSQCLNSAWCLHGHPYINWVTNKELKNMEKDFVVILCLSASKVLSLVFLWGDFNAMTKFLHSRLESIWVNAIHMPRYFEHWCLQDLNPIKFRNILKWLAHRGYSGGWSRKHVICTRSRRRWRGWAASHPMSSIIFHYVASIVFATEFNRSKPFIKPKDFRISNNDFNLISFWFSLDDPSVRIHCDVGV